MPKPDPEPRLAPIDTNELSDDARTFLANWTGGFFANADKHPVLLTFAHHPHLADLFSRLNIHVLTTNTLPVKLRQIAIMRLAWVTKATYMWSSHLKTSVSAGLDPDFYEPVKVGADDPYFDEVERHVILATEDFIKDARVGDASWAVLSAALTKEQMLDFLFTVGVYFTIAGVMRSCGMQRPDELLELAEKYGAP